MNYNKQKQKQTIKTIEIENDQNDFHLQVASLQGFDHPFKRVVRVEAAAAQSEASITEHIVKHNIASEQPWFQQPQH